MMVAVAQDNTIKHFSFLVCSVVPAAALLGDDVHRRSVEPISKTVIKSLLELFSFCGTMILIMRAKQANHPLLNSQNLFFKTALYSLSLYCLTRIAHAAALTKQHTLIFNLLTRFVPTLKLITNLWSRRMRNLQQPCINAPYNWSQG